MILSGAGAQQTLVGRALSLSPIRLIGRLSYSWYLWHWPALVYLRERVVDPSTRLSVGVVLLSLVPAAIAYRLVESPIRFSSTLARRPRLVVAGAVLLAVVTAAAATGATRYATWTLGTPKYASILAARAKGRTYGDGCQVSLLAVESPECRYGPGRNDTTVVLFGDSHAAQWFPAMDSVASMRGWTLINLTKTGCPSVLVGVPNAKLGRRYTECDRWREHAFRRIAALKPQIVVVTSDRSYQVFVGDSLQHTDSSAAARREWHDGIVRTLSALRPSGARLALIEDTPLFPWDVPRCLVTHVDAPKRCAVPRRRALSDGAAMSQRHAALSVAGTGYLTLNARICDGDLCPAQRDGVVRYQDDNHLAVRFVQSLAPALSTELTRVLSSPVHDSTP